MIVSYLIRKVNKASKFICLDLNSEVEYSDIKKAAIKIIKNSKIVDNISKTAGKVVGFTKGGKPIFTADTMKKFAADGKLLTVLAVLVSGQTVRDGFLICDEEGNVATVNDKQIKQMANKGYKFTNISEDLKLSLKGFEEKKDIPIIKVITTTITTTKDEKPVKVKAEKKKGLTKDEAIKLMLKCAPSDMRIQIESDDWDKLIFEWYGSLCEIKEKFENSEIPFENIIETIHNIRRYVAKNDDVLEKATYVCNDTVNFSYKDIKIGV